MSNIAPGAYTVQELLDHFDFNVDEKAAVEYESSGSHVDYRRVKIGGLGFDSLEQTISVPDAAKSLDLTLDGEVVAQADVG